MGIKHTNMHTIFMRIKNMNKEFIEDIIKSSVKHGVEIQPLKDDTFIAVRGD